MKSEFNQDDELELIDEKNGLYAKVRVRDNFGKAAIHLTPDQLVQHAMDCLTLAVNMRSRR